MDIINGQQQYIMIICENYREDKLYASILPTRNNIGIGHDTRAIKEIVISHKQYRDIKDLHDFELYVDEEWHRLYRTMILEDQIPKWI